MNKWLTSTNAKEIGTLYLIFSIFAGISPKIVIMPAINLVICGKNDFINKVPIKILPYVFLVLPTLAAQIYKVNK